MKQEKLKETLESHSKYLNKDPDGKRADLNGADLIVTDLHGANLRNAILRNANLSVADLSGADLSVANLSGAILRNANLSVAGLSGADLRGADIDFASWPLWCGSLDVNVDKRIFCQFAYHLCRLICDDPECIAAQNALLDLANQFHLVGECGKIEQKKPKEITE